MEKKRNGQKTRKTLQQALRALVLVDSIIFFLIAGSGMVLSHGMYKRSMEKETGDRYRLSFSSIENTLHFIENIAFQITNDKTVRKALSAMNQQSSDRYPLLDELYYRIITSSLVANDAVTIIVTDQAGHQYGTGSLTENFTDRELSFSMELFAGRRSKWEPIWFAREDSGELIYGREIYHTPFAGQYPLGRIYVRVNLDKLKADGRPRELPHENLVILYQGKPVYSKEPDVFTSPEILENIRKNPRYFVVEADSDFSGLAYVGYQPYARMLTSTNTLLIFFTAAVLAIVIVSFLATARVVHQVTAPIGYLEQQMKMVEKGDFSARISLEHLGTRIWELEKLALNFNLMTEEINRLVQDNYLRAIKEKEYQLKALQSQIHPHFLYNALDTINWLAMDCDKQEISSMVQALAAIFRESTNQKRYMIPLREELALVSSYVTIQKIRLEERLEVCFSIPPECMELFLPKLSLQPILENSIKYGAEKAMTPCVIHVHASERAGHLRIRIWDNGPGIPKEILSRLKNGEQREGPGVGLMNIEERIRMLGGGGSKMQIYSSKIRGTLVCLAIAQPGGDWS